MQSVCPGGLFPKLFNSNITGNHANVNGGGFFTFATGGNCNPILINVNLSGNNALNLGGAMFADAGS